MYRKYFKRFFDFFISLIALVLLSPLFLVIALLLYFANEGAGVIFRQKRPGLNGKIFYIFKFKTMNEKTDNNGKLLPDKERITKIGRFIRTTSLDELPQLFNVFKGDMALIGPRPLLVEYLSLYSKEQMRRHDVRPGITGWAQINGRNNISWSEKFRLDVYYVDNLSFILDFKTIYLTLKGVVQKKDIDSPNKKVTVPLFNGKN